MRRNRTSVPPLFNGLAAGHHHWQWTVTMKVGSSGYATEIHVRALRPDIAGDLVGTATATVPAFADVAEVMSEVATEAMLAACEPDLFGNVPHRIVQVSTTF